jgi:hypothetical protein
VWAKSGARRFFAIADIFVDAFTLTGMDAVSSLEFCREAGQRFASSAFLAAKSLSVSGKFRVRRVATRRASGLWSHA